MSIAALIALALGFLALTLVAFVAMALGLPGVWALVLAAGAVEWAWPEVFTTPALIAVVALAIVGEILELFASAAGAGKAGGTKRAALAAIFGGVVGGIVGTVVLPIPIVGTILGAVVGAGLFATLADATRKERDWKRSYRVGRGAATGRLLAVVLKGAVVVIVGLLLATATLVPAL